MKINKEISHEILKVLMHEFPHMLTKSGYESMSSKHGKDIIDGHIVYLKEHKKLEAKLEYHYPTHINDVKGWVITNAIITAVGIDYIGGS